MCIHRYVSRNCRIECTKHDIFSLGHISLFLTKKAFPLNMTFLFGLRANEEELNIVYIHTRSEVPIYFHASRKKELGNWPSSVILVILTQHEETYMDLAMMASISRR